MPTTDPFDSDIYQRTARRAEDQSLIVSANPFDPRFPLEPPVMAVIRFERTVQGVVYAHVAFRAPNDQWYLSGHGVGHREGTTWEQVRSFITDDAVCEIATDWFTVPAIIDTTRTMTAQEYVRQFYSLPNPTASLPYSGGPSDSNPDEGPQPPADKHRLIRDNPQA